MTAPCARKQGNKLDVKELSRAWYSHWTVKIICEVYSILDLSSGALKSSSFQMVTNIVSWSGSQWIQSLSRDHRVWGGKTAQIECQSIIRHYTLGAIPPNSIYWHVFGRWNKTEPTGNQCRHRKSMQIWHTVDSKPRSTWCRHYPLFHQTNTYQ